MDRGADDDIVKSKVQSFKWIKPQV